MKSLNLNGLWKMKRVDETRWIDAKVPGSVMADLLNAGLMEDPFYRDNEDKAREISEYDYEYGREFVVDRDLADMDRVCLLCEGIDTVSDIYINGIFVAHTENMHRTYEFDIKKLVRAGRNEIRVILHSPIQYIREKAEKDNLTWGAEQGPIAGFQHIRKASCMFGWDWGPQLPDLGIWRNISVIGFSDARIKDVYITQQHSGGKVNLNFAVNLEKQTQADIEAEIEIVSPSGEVIKAVCRCQDSRNTADVAIDNPLLWWPNGYGKQPLYKCTVTLKKGCGILDTKSYTIGLRTITVRRDKDQWGESFEFVVNGVSVFAMGADYIPEDNILSRCSPERTEKLIKDSVEAHFNCLRVWGGAYYMEDFFYDICDKYGILIWQDLLFACATYEMTEKFTEEITKETEDNVKRLRHHACLALWCGNNEMEWGWVDWGFNKPAKLRTDYIKQFEIVLPEVVRKNDPHTFYWLASPSSGGGFDNPNDPTRGDVHWWDVWHGGKPFTDYRRFKFRFASEYGFQSIPSMKTIETFTLPEDRNLFSYVMEKHEKHPDANTRLMTYLPQEFKFPKDFGSLIYATQLLQADAIKYGVEHWRRNRGICMGSVYWQLNDCWPVTSWSSIDYYGRWKALHYYAKRFYTPVLLSACDEGNTVVFNVSNETFESFTGRIEWELINNLTGTVDHGSFDVEVDGLSAKDFDKVDFSKYLSTIDEKHNVYLYYSLVRGSEVVSASALLFVKPKHFNFTDPGIKITVEDKQDRFMVNVSSEAFAKGIELDLENNDCKFSDNYFDLPKGGRRTVEVLKDSLRMNVPIEEFKKEIKVFSVYDMA